MADGSTIEWTDATWNPVTGCTKISRGCDNCYAERFAERFRGVAGHPFATGFTLTLRAERLEQPLYWRRPRMIFVNSMSDLFHKEVPQAFVDKVFDTMERATWHSFQVLTKRSSLMRDYLRSRYGERDGPAHIWCGVSVEDDRAKTRVAHLRKAPAGIRFLSIEPLISPIGAINLTGINWVIVGGESGPRSRPMRIEWVREVRDQCRTQGVAFFFKQWGGRRPKAGGRQLDGREWNEFPIHRRQLLGCGRMKTPEIGTLVGPWAKTKLDALQRYLDFYTKVLKNQRWRTIYVDAYAGGGRAVIRTAERDNLASLLEENQIDADQLELINGSPRVALDIANPFARYIFIEPDKVRAADLQTLQAEYSPSRQIDVRIEDAVAGVRWVLSQNISRATHRGVAFLDPFGARLDWSTIQALADTKLFEVVITFALNMAIQRMLPNSGIFQVGWRERLDAYFGTRTWHDEVYREQTGLLGAFIEKQADYLDRLLALYRDRLRSSFGFVSQPMLIRNTRGAPLYYLLWAGPNRKGMEGANYILGMGERLDRNLRRTRKG